MQVVKQLRYNNIHFCKFESDKRVRTILKHGQTINGHKKCLNINTNTHNNTNA